MIDLSKYIYKSSPLIPNAGKDILLQAALKNYQIDPVPAKSLAVALRPAFTTHAMHLKTNLSLLEKFGLSYQDLDRINLGFKFPLDTIYVSQLMSQIDPRNHDSVFEELANPTLHVLTAIVQQTVKENLRATINLMRRDPSGAGIFEFLSDYPFDQSIFTLIGIEIAAIVYMNLAPDFAKIINDDSWLNAPEDPKLTEYFQNH